MAGSSKVGRVYRWVFGAVGCVGALMVVAACCFIPGGLPGGGGGGGSGTNLVILNNTGQTIPVLLTLGSGYGISDVSQLPASWGISGSGLKGQFTLGPNQSVSFNSGDATFSGNIAFGPTFTSQGCGQTPCYPNATNLAEWTLNHPGETVDISGVNGTNAYIQYQLQGGAKWTDNVTSGAITSFANAPIGQYVDTPGVYGWQATTCTGNANPPNPVGGCAAPINAPNHSELASVQLCNVQRTGDAAFGGTVRILFNGWTPNSEPPNGCGN